VNWLKEMVKGAKAGHTPAEPQVRDDRHAVPETPPHRA
jgi:hypothetical protein